jgi:shikimate kinase
VEGKTIAAIFKDSGEAYFRLLERDALKAVNSFFLAQQNNNTHPFLGIVATGGGAPCFHDNMTWMNQHGITLWLNLPIAVLVERLNKDSSKRPLLEEKSELELKQFIHDKLEERKPYYSQAQLEINSLVDINELIQKIKDA